jgi:hypothetical protein
MHPPAPPRRLLPAAVLLLAACADAAPLLPPRPAEPDAARQAMECRVSVAQARMECAPASPPGGPSADRMVGGQDVYVKLASSGTAYDAGAGIFRTDVTVESLLSQAIGTTDGVGVTGVRVFFHSGPTTTGGAGLVGVENSDGTATFTAEEQPYFLYPEILPPYHISAPRTWRFTVPASVQSFAFTVYVSAPMPNGSGPLLDLVWTGASSASWQDSANWQRRRVPDSTSVVAIPSASLLPGGRMPEISADLDVMHLRVGTGSSVDLGGHSLRVRGNLDVVGTITGGPMQLTGPGVVFQGAMPSLQVKGRAAQQGAARVRGPLSIRDGSLATRSQPLSIDIP